MINVVYGTTFERKTMNVGVDTTIAEFLNSVGLDYSTGGYSLNGTTLQFGDYDKSFAEMGITSTAYLLKVTKADNA